MEPITIAAVAGAVTPALVAVITRAPWPTRTKQLIAYSVAAWLVFLGLVATYRPETWQVWAAAIMAAIGVCQVVYTALRPVWDALRALTTPTQGRHAAGADQ
ncbi:hypothetical protein [Actinomyces provencensis]|uniref:hypothetical protein n=1 Tax=Actinomyces provencensis TaxID=1720198 RepID=UPI00096A7C55|nr:hypothetical protein [Actinomyces provencensis]